METLTVKEAAKLLGVSPVHLRKNMLQKEYDFGTVTIGKTGRHTYTIYKPKIEKYIAECGGVLPEKEQDTA